MKTTLKYFSAFLLVLFFVSCEKADQEIKRLDRKDGKWKIESVQYQTYDSTGNNVTADSTHTDVGELVFFKSPTLDALWSGYLVVLQLPNASGGIDAFAGNLYFDGDRVFIQEDADIDHSFPADYKGVWNVTENKRNKQVWTVYTLASSGALGWKKTMTLKKE